MLLKASALLAVYAGTALAGDLYMAFYNDDQCTQGEGKHVDTKNPGCLKEVGRQSFGDAGGTDSFYIPVLVGYTDDNCQDEIGCQALPAHADQGLCQNFHAEQWQWANKAHSFKFISNGPDGDPVCPNGCAGECPGGHAKRDLFDLKSHAIRNKTQAIGGALKNITASLGHAVSDHHRKNVTLGGKHHDEHHHNATLVARVKKNDYAFCSNDDCTDCGTSIEAVNGGCSIEGQRKSIKSEYGGSFRLGGYNNAQQLCEGEQTATVEIKGKGCFPLKSGADGGPTSYQVLGIEG